MGIARVRDQGRVRLEERAAIIEHDAEMFRQEVERLALAGAINQWLAGRRQQAAEALRVMGVSITN